MMMTGVVLVVVVFSVFCNFVNSLVFLVSPGATLEADLARAEEDSKFVQERAAEEMRRKSEADSTLLLAREEMLKTQRELAAVQRR